MAGSKFVWHELMSVDKTKSLEFFTKLFGWTVEEREMPGLVYPMIFNGKEGIGGAVDLEKESGIPSHWISYISCANVDDFCAKATDMGATVGVPPMDIPDVGRFAVVADAQGAYFSPFQGLADEEMPDQPEPTDGSVVWNELMTTDPEAAANFYSSMFGWDIDVMDVGTGPYRIAKNGDTMVAGIGKAPDDMPVSMWVIYFQTSDIGATMKQIGDLGGTVLFPAMDVPTVGKLTWATDPVGTTFAVVQPSPAE